MPNQPAIVGTMRMGGARLGYIPAALTARRRTRARVFLAGVLANARFERDGLSIRDVINESPSTCTITGKTTAPTVAQALRITINSDTPRLLFNGAIQTVGTTYAAGKKTNLLYPVSATDDLERLKRRRPFGTWTSISATTIVQQLVASFAPGFTTTNVQAGLPAISLNLDGSEGFDGALKQIAGLIAGYYYVEDLDIHLFTAEATDLPDPVDTAHPPLIESALTVERDLSQLRTRVYGKGHGEPTPTDVGIGETILPVANSVMFNPAGGRAIAETQRLTYTGIQTGGAGSLVGPGAAPSVAPSVNVAPGSGVESGAHQYAYTWVTAAGESLPSPAAPLTVGVPTAPSVAPGVYATGSNIFSSDLAAGDGVVYSYSWSTAVSIDDLAQETARSPTTSITAAYDPGIGGVSAPIVYVVGSTDPRVRWIRVWKSVNGGAVALAAIYPSSAKGVANPGTASSVFTVDSGVFGSGHSTATLNQAAVAGIAIGPSGTTARKVYRTAAGAAQLKLHSTIADNTTTTATDSTADASLGANVPTTDTSGIAQPAGQVNAGSTSILTASAGPFSSTGGWAVLGSKAVRYTGISGNSLTGIPPSGPGAIVNTIRYGEHVDPSPALTGVSGITAAIASGATVNLWVQRDSLAGQAAMAALDGGDGMYEFYVSDERRGEASLIALCDANLALYKAPLVTVRYATRDVKTKSGKPVTFTNILGYSGTLTIQDVQISEIDIAPGTAPKFSATASSVRVSLEAMLQQILGAGA